MSKTRCVGFAIICNEIGQTDPTPGVQILNLT